MEALLCRLEDIKCVGSKRGGTEFGYFISHGEGFSKFSNALFHDEPYHNLTMLQLSDWNIDSTRIIKQFPFEKWLKHWDVTETTHELSKQVLYGRSTNHYTNPPNAMVFAGMAFHRRWKFILHIREPIARMWSVQQHWHQYDGSPEEIRAAAASNLWTSYHHRDGMEMLVNAIGNESVSNDEIIGMYYFMYWSALKLRAKELILI